MNFKSLLKYLLPLLLLFPLTPAWGTDSVLNPELVNEGWIALFDGATLFGWEPTSDANWHVEEEGTLLVDSGTPGWLMHTSEFADFELQVEFLAPPQTNSGVFLRSPPEPTNPAEDCYEVNIAPAANPYPTGSLVERVKAQTSRLAPNDWQTMVVRAEGPTISVAINGQEVATTTDPQPRTRGHIGLQFREGQIAFRNLRLKPLGTQPLFNGRDLTGWNTTRADQSQFAVDADGDLTVKQGPGQLESEAEFGDFVLQLECKVNGEGLNSGVFFRCIPGDQLMGYESQIHNAMVDGNPAEPVDCGTGGIFRRQNARRIVARDNEWFAKTIVATGPHLAVWVGGYQVSDWTDDRPANENPRRGLRLEPGTIALQGHDPTTDLEFRNLEIAPLPAAP